ncbi:MAG: YidC/Oxa1 family membrane protein insertase [Oscillospiraceae bacterium]|nr:YidC/Oxa1 family membrane protein insertase [Oscillospiraceae bacterium]
MLDAIARPFGLLLMIIYNYVNNYGVAIILITLIIKLVLLPFQMKAKRGQLQQTKLKPLLDDLKRKHGANQNKLQEETMKLYKEEGISPASGCIWAFIPLPILIAFIRVVSQPITMMMGLSQEEYAIISNIFQNRDRVSHLFQTIGAQFGNASFIPHTAKQFVTYFSTILTGLNFDPGRLSAHIQITQTMTITANLNQFLHISPKLQAINFGFFNNINLGHQPQWDYLWNPNRALYGTWIAGFVLFLIPFLSAGSQYLSTAITQKLTPQAAGGDQTSSMNTMFKVMPLMSVVFSFTFPAALGFYWTISTLFQVIQDVILTKVYTKIVDEEELVRIAAREERAAELEAKRLETERRKAEGIAARNRNTSKRKIQANEKQEQIGRSVEWARRNEPPSEPVPEPGRVSDRRYARGRAYDPDRYAYDEDDEYEDEFDDKDDNEEN